MAEVTYMHETGALELGDVSRKGENCIKSNNKIAIRGVGGKGKK